MQLNIIQEKENPLLDRKEVKILVESKITPNYKETRKILSEKFNINKENIKINSIKGKYGLSEFIISANLYKTKEIKNSIEKSSKKEIEADKSEEIENKEDSQEEIDKTKEIESNEDVKEIEADKSEEKK